jgi:hypothetical protein
VIQTSTLLWFSRDMAYPDSVIETAARYHTVWLLGHTDLAGPCGPDYSSIDALVCRLRAANPLLKIGLYVGGLAYKAEIDPPALWLTDADLLHRPDGSPLSWCDTTGMFSGGDVFTYRLPNLGSPAVQDKLLDGYCQLVQEHQLDGILIDGYDPTAYAVYVRGAPPNGMYGATDGCLEGAWHQPDLWMQALAQFGERLRWRLEQIGRQFVFNGIHPYGGYSPDNAIMAWFGEHRTHQVDRASGAMMEAIHLAYDDPTAFSGIVRTVQLATARRRNVFMLASPWNSQPKTQEVERFYLGLYLLVQEPPYTSFGYHPHVPYRAWDGDHPQGQPAGDPAVFWSDDWTRDYGYPLTPCMMGDPVGVAWRAYSKGLVLVNPTAIYQQFPLGGVYRIWDQTAGALLDMTPAAPGYIMNVPPKASWYLFNAAPA